MEPTEERSSSTIPKFLVYFAMFFVIARLTTFGYEMHFKSEIDSNKPEITWIDLTKKLTNKLNTREITGLKQSTISKNSSVLCPKCHSVSKETLAQMKQDTSYDLSRHIDEVLELDKHNNKPIIYEFFAKNSDPCNRMEQTALSNSQVVELVENNFTPVRVSYTPNKSKLLNKTLIDFRRKYRVCAFPTLVVVDKNGKEVTNLVGSCSSLSTYKFLSRTVARVKAMHSKSKTTVAYTNK